jgi:hypothetical protein
VVEVVIDERHMLLVIDRNSDGDEPRAEQA